MSFKHIIRIENLVGFDRLTKLCLDNNSIEEITNIGHIKTLRWLDLSFNKIRKIQGLSDLVNLEDLSLYANKISLVDGLENLKNLQCLSLGNNRIESLEQVIKLRNIRSLRMLTLADNPICSEMEYRPLVLAYVDTLKYLDYALVDPVECHNAKEQYHDELMDVEEKESVVAEKLARDKTLEAHLAHLEQAAILFSHTLFDDIFADDAEIEKLKHLPGIKELVEQFKTAFKALSEEFVTVSTEKYEKKKKEINDFDKTVSTLRANAETESSQLIENFNKSRKAAVALLTNVDSAYTASERASMVKKLSDELDKVCDELMTIELRLVEKFEVLVDEFDNRLTEMKGVALEAQQLFFRAVEEMEDKFSGGMRAAVQDLIDRLAREELAEDYLDDEAMNIIVDKDACMGLVTASHDAHIGKLMKKEDEARNNENKRYQDMISGQTQAERARNRNRVLQIHEYCKAAKGRLQALLRIDEDKEYEDN